MQYAPERRLVFQPSQQYAPLIHRKENIFSPLRITTTTQQHQSPQQIKQLSRTTESDTLKEIRILIQHNQKMKDQINQQAIDFEQLKNNYDKVVADQLRLINELEQISRVSEQQQKELKLKQEVVKELQHQLESKQFTQSFNQEETQQLRGQLQIKEQEILRLKQINEDKGLENQEIRNTLSTINQKVQFMTSQKDQQYAIIDRFNKELQDEVTNKTQQILSINQNLSQSQSQVNQQKFELEQLKSQIQSQQQLLPLQSLQQKYLILCLENERLHNINITEIEKKKNLEIQLQKAQGDIELKKQELIKITEEFQRMQQGLAFEQQNLYMIDNLKSQLNFYIEENARLNAMFRQSRG